jgi:hypothetical protein
VNPPEAGSLCPINEFDFWLRNQTVAPLPSDEYTSSCNGADSLPMSEEDFHSCFISWSRLIGEKNVLSNDGKVKIMRMKVANTVGTWFFVLYVIFIAVVIYLMSLFYLLKVGMLHSPQWTSFGIHLRIG